MKTKLYTLPSGHDLDLTTCTIDSGRPGPHVHIQASVHGSELQGSLVIQQLKENLKLIKGKVTLIPLANPLGTNNKISTFTQGRYHPGTMSNWNRLYVNVCEHLDIPSWVQENKTSDQLVAKFKETLKETFRQNFEQDQAYGIDSEKILVYHLQSLAASADIVLDLHTGPCATHYLYVPEHLQEAAQDLKLPFHLLIPPEFAGAMDEACFIPWFHFNNACKELGLSHHPFEAYTVELGNEEVVCSEQAKSDFAMIMHFLSKRGLVEHHDFSGPVFQQKLESFKTYYAQSGGLIEYLQSPGDKVQKGDDLYKIHSPTHGTTQTITAVHDAYIINHTPSAALMEGSIVYQVLEI